MRTLGLLSLAIVILSACKPEAEISSIDPVNWEKRSLELNPADSLLNGSSYLSVYSEIYSQTEHRTHDLTATVSMRNINTADTIFLSKAAYYNTEGSLIRDYFDHPIFIAPMETVEIIIDERDQAGGSGANFLFNWHILPGSNAPHFEAVMISTSGQQGLSFTTRGLLINPL